MDVVAADRGCARWCRRCGVVVGTGAGSIVAGVGVVGVVAGVCMCVLHGREKSWGLLRR